jgi:hypothetical protein
LASIALFSFLTSHRPIHCRCDPFLNNHPSSCPCLEINFSITPAPPKERLKAFGGWQDIEDYRAGFKLVKSLTLLRPETLKTGTLNLNSSRKTRSYVYEYEDVYPMPCKSQSETKTQQLQFQFEAPVVNRALIQRLKSSFF